MHITKIRSIIKSSISENSLVLSRESPLPPSIRSTIAYPRPEAISTIIFPCNGAKLTMPSSTGFESAFVNSEYVTASEFILDVPLKT